jgi:protein SCO1/2
MQVLFVSVDPERDSPAVLAKYVPAFNPAFVGLTGDAHAIATTAQEFKVFYQKQPVPGGGYTVDHSTGTYIYDTAGRLRLYAAYGTGADKMLHDIRLLLKGG